MKSHLKQSNILTQWLDKHQLPVSLIVIGLAIILGLLSASGIWLFEQLIELFYYLFFELLGERLGEYGHWTIMILPILGGLLVGGIMYLFVGEERHHGVAGIMESVALGGGRLRYRRMPLKALAASISIGSGASVGPEDPSVQIGSSLGSMLGQVLHLSDERVRALVAAGAAAGISSAFNAPIAGIFFALEIILGEISGTMLGVVVLASVVAATLTQAVSGTQPAFSVPAYSFDSIWELPLYVLLGILAGAVAALYVRLLYLMHDSFHHLAAPRWVKPAIAGLAVGVVGIFLPQVFGIGYATIDAILHGVSYSVGFLLLLMVAKMILTAVSIGGGFQGGVFAPSLFLGATLGAAYGMVMDVVFPGLHITPAAYAMVGMAAVLVGAVHAPLTAVILLFEMTNDYHIILPLMLSVMFSLLLSQWLEEDSVYTLGLARKGLRIRGGQDVYVLQGIEVSEIMQTSPPTILENEPVSVAANLLISEHTHGLAVVNNLGELVGIVTLQDIDRAQTEQHGDWAVGQICTHDLLTAYPDESLHTALHRMSIRDIGRLPVVSRDNPRQLLGMLRRNNVVKAYDLAVTRRTILRHRAHEARLGILSGVNVQEVVVSDEAVCAGEYMKDIAWPHDCNIASLRRGSQMIVPRGSTMILPGDVLIVVAELDVLDKVRLLCQPTAESDHKL